MKNNPLIKWWLTPKFPQTHVENALSYQPSGITKVLRNLYRTWVVHPIKRRIAKYYLAILRSVFGLRVIGITGSSGKTTTKEMLASILSLNGKTVYSFANIDPIFNIPTTILMCTPVTKYLILEMGVEYKNEMDFYLWLAKPDIGIITNVYATHTKYFGDERGVLKEKSKLVLSLPNKAFAVVNSESNLLMDIKNKIKAKVVLFGKEGNIYSNNVSATKDFKTKFNLNIKNNSENIYLNILGKQFVSNSLAAASAAESLNIPLKTIKRGLEKYKSIEHRMNIIKLNNGAILIDDSYNNNPSAAKEALTSFKMIELKRKRIIVFGDMLELGKLEESSHKEIGKLLPGYCDSLILVGNAVEYSFKEANKTMKSKCILMENQMIATEELRKIITPNSLVLVKGSRSIGLDKLVNSINRSQI